MENDEYYLLNNKSAQDNVEKELYQRMVKAAVKLNRIFPSVRGMTDDVRVLGASKQPTEEMKVDETGTWVMGNMPVRQWGRSRNPYSSIR